MYYKVLVKCGHVGRNKYILKRLYIKAISGKEAAKIARNTPRVKHNHKDVIRELKKITFDEYVIGLKMNLQDKYFKADNKQEQKIFKCVDYEDLNKEMKEEKYKVNRNGRRLKVSAKELDMINEIKGVMNYA